MNALLSLELITSPVVPIIVLVTLVLFCAVLAPRPSHPMRLLIGALVGTVIVSVVVLLLQRANVFEGELPDGTVPWVLLTGGLLGVAAVGLFTRPWWRRTLAGLLVVSSVLCLGLAVNALYGITHTPASILGLATAPVASLPADKSGPRTLRDWRPPADMPAVGTVGTLSGAHAIPTSRPYTARPASVYLPPAALVADAPKLPVIVMMMGQPGSPDPTLIAAALNAYAERHQGVAPIAVVVDQLAGSSAHNPLCTDSTKYGAVATYVNEDVPRWIRSHLNVSDDIRDWTIAGYSNGGSCAIDWAAQHPTIWGNLLDISGNEYPGSENPANARAVWHDDMAAYEASLPAAQLKLPEHRGAYAGHLAVFTYGALDHHYGPGQKRNVVRAEDAGFTVLSRSLPGLSHVGKVVSEGLSVAMNDLGAHLGLDRFAKEASSDAETHGADPAPMLGSSPSS
ncbi:alpha/beta hydrolase [Microbacterium gorillae]|uniref:alpha/beta hydrolase n=1 Tax=Microbacterium gorillae TaxID=1231063 RepID=UPI0006936689|nr:alpha/beta hydrolase-fold protein [Microbacterium gorillae]